MNAKEWLIGHFKKMPYNGVFIIKGHEDEAKLIEVSKEVLIEYNDIFREDGFEIEFSNDYSSITKLIYPF